jgi:hypothetical protein
MHATIATLSAALCGVTALSLAGCDAHALTARLPGASSTGPAQTTAPAADPAEPTRGTAAVRATAPPDTALGAQPDSDAIARERGREKGCDEPGGCYYGVRLVGYPIEEAKRRAIEFGFQGEIVLDDSYGQSSSCKHGTVCEVIPANWPVYGDSLTLYVNYAPRELKINKPE